VAPASPFDLEYNPDDYPTLLEPILSGKADAVFGSRFMGGRPHRVLYFWHMVGNRFLTLLSNMFTNQISVQREFLAICSNSIFIGKLGV
jgi:hypothetical protein